MLTFDNIIVSARNGNLFDQLGENEEVIAYLPLAWVGDHIFSYAQSYVAGYLRQLPGSRRRPWSRIAARSAPPMRSRRRASTRTC